MLRGTLAFLLLVACAVAGAEVRRHLRRRLGISSPATEALGFLVLGVALGARGFGVFPAEVLESLRVVVLLGLGWIGLMVGLQVDLGVLRRLRPWHWRIGTTVPLLVGAGVAAAAALAGLAPPECIALAAIAMVSSPVALAALARTRPPVNRAAMRLLRLVGALSGLPAIVVFGLAEAVWAAPSVASELSWWQLAFCGPALGLVLGYAILALTRGETGHIQLLTVLLGGMAILAGASGVLGLSPLLAGAAAGVVIINRSVLPHRILAAAHSLEMPLVIALLVLVGASWSGLHLASSALVVLVAVRLLALAGAGLLLGRVAAAHGVQLGLPSIGLGLLPQGELALGLLVALTRWIPPSSGLFAAVVVALVVNQVAGRWWLARRLFPVASGPGPRTPGSPQAEPEP